MDFPLVVNSSSGTSSLLLSRPGVAIPYIAVLGLAAVVGTAGNVLIIGTLLVWRGSPTVGNMFIVNLACSDIIVTAVINPFAIVGVVQGVHFFDGREWLCTALASTCVTSCVVSLLSIGCISVNRLIYICHHSLYRRIYTKQRSLAMCLLTWIAGFLLDLPSHVGWSRHTFDDKTNKCLWDRNMEYSYTCFFVIGGVMAPLSVITICYVRIFVHMGAAKQKLAQLTQGGSQRMLMKTIRQSRMMFVIFLAFTTCWTPYIIILLLDKYDTYSIEGHLYCSLAAHIHASINFIIYGIANKKVRLGYKAFIREKICCQEHLVTSSVYRAGSIGTKVMDSASDFISLGRMSTPTAFSQLFRCCRPITSPVVPEVEEQQSSSELKSVCKSHRGSATVELLPARKKSVSFADGNSGRSELTGPLLPSFPSVNAASACVIAENTEV